MKAKIYISIIISIISIGSFNAQNIFYQSWISKFSALGTSCTNELGDEEYTWYGFVKDNVYTAETSTGCQQKTRNGATSITGTMGLRSRTNTTATIIYGRIRAWENDSGDRCTYDSGGVNSDDCLISTISSYSLSNPDENNFITNTRTIGNSSFTMDLTYQYRYSVTTIGNGVDNTIESFSTTGSRQFWGAQGAWASDGIDCAASGTITHNQSSSFQTTVTNKSSVTFKWRVSSATGDYLQVFVNNVLDEQITGDSGWLTKTISLTGTTNTIEWRYVKDASGSSGIDRGFIDAVSFADNTSLSIESNKLDMVSIYPNPIESTINFKGLSNDNYNLEIYDITGKKVKSIKGVKNSLDVSSLINGFYIGKLYIGTNSKSFKFIKK